MFSDRDASSSGFDGGGDGGPAFPSDWRKTLSLKSSTAQTEPTKSQDGECQTSGWEDVGVQAQEDPPDPENAAKKLNSPSLAKFLARATPMLERELQAALRSRAFDGYELIEEEEERAAGKTHTLEVEGQQQEDSLRVSSVSWSSSSSSPSLAVAFEHHRHEDWCDHETALCLWNTARRDFDPGNPQKRCEAPCCLTSVRFHPRDPSLVAAGGFTGEVFLWSVEGASASTLVASSSMRGHREKVTSLQWLLGSDADPSFRHTSLLTTALDGKILKWSVDARAGSMAPVRAFAVKAEHLPRQLKVRARSRAEVGVTSLSRNSEDADIIVIGTEAGAVFQGNLSSELPMVAPEEDEARVAVDTELEWRDPVTVTFSSHKGRVLDVQFSPFHRDVFLSLGSDQEIRVHSLLNPQIPSYILHREQSGMSAIRWSPARPAVLAASTLDGALVVYDLRQTGAAAAAGSGGADKGAASSAGGAEPVRTLRASENRSTARAPALTSLAFHDAGATACAGDSLGRAHVWKLDTELSSKRPAEVRVLNAFLTVEAEE